MEVSMDFKPSSTVGASPMAQPFSSVSTSPSRKRAFSEVEDHNTPKTETNKLQKRGNDGNDQENRNPLLIDETKMDTTDKPTSIILPATQASVSEPDQLTADMSSINKAPATPGPILDNNPLHNQQQAPSTPTATTTIPPENKKQKLSPASKEAKRLEKEEKDRMKLEEKAKKEAEKRAKDEEKKKKEVEREEEKKKRDAEREEERKKREEKKRQKEEEKHAKEEEKRKKEEEKEKKERSQMRLNAFFAKPTASSTAKPANPLLSSPGKAPVPEITVPASPEKAADTSQSDYRKEFPAFFLQSNTQLSSPHQFQRDSEALDHIRQKLDGFLKQPTTLPAYRGSELFDMIPYRRRKGRNIRPVKTILANAQNDGNTIDLTASSALLREQLNKVAMKSLRFGEDVRPPYYGTFTKTLSETQAHKICRAPYTRIIPEVNYDYDSEAEWEEPEEGEDLDSEGEEELSEDGDDDMDGFLDDEEEEIDGRRRLIIGDQEPVSTGIRWQYDGKVDSDMEVYRIESLSDAIQFPIDPFSTAYWPRPKAAEQAATKGSSSLAPSKATLHAYSTNAPGHTQLPLAPPPSRPITSTKGKPFPPEHLTEFKETVEGCDLSKAGLIEVLKKRFPKVSKDTLKDTVNAVAIRVGQKEADKRWTCK